MRSAPFRIYYNPNLSFLTSSRLSSLPAIPFKLLNSIVSASFLETGVIVTLYIASFRLSVSKIPLSLSLLTAVVFAIAAASSYDILPSGAVRSIRLRGVTAPVIVRKQHLNRQIGRGLNRQIKHIRLCLHCQFFFFWLYPNKRTSKWVRMTAGETAAFSAKTGTKTRYV